MSYRVFARKYRPQTFSEVVGQDHITRTRLAGEPPHVLLVPRLGNIGLLEFTRAHEAIAEGRHSVHHALPALKRYV